MWMVSRARLRRKEALSASLSLPRRSFTTRELRTSNHHISGHVRLAVLKTIQRGSGDRVLLIRESPTQGDGRIEDERHQYLWPSWRELMISSRVSLFALLSRKARRLAAACLTSALRRLVSGTSRAIGFPW